MRIEKKGDLEDLNYISKYIYDIFSTNKILLLRGDLSSGKTTLVQKIAKIMGIKQQVTSPTFSIQNIYDEKLCHYDIYNIKSSGFIEKGFLEILFDDRFHIIEWADDKLIETLDNLGVKYTLVEILIKNNERIYRIDSA